MFACVGILGQLPSTALSAADTKNAESTVNVTEADNGKDIDLTTAQTLQIKLKSIAGTGYAWTLDGDPAPLKLVKQFSQHNKSTSGRAGAPSFSVFQLKAGSAGLANVTFVYRRSWEYNVPPAKTFSLRVNVR
jgi:predicted secreted protein